MCSIQRQRNEIQIIACVWYDVIHAAAAAAAAEDDLSYIPSEHALAASRWLYVIHTN